MAGKYKVNTAIVKVSIGPKGGNRVARIHTKGTIVPDGVDEQLLASLAKRKLISKVTAAEAQTMAATADGTKDNGAGVTTEQQQ